MFEDITKVVLVTDLDGTLLTSEKKITEADFQAIRRFRDLGGRFTVATGRTVQTFEQYRAMLDINMPVIMYNGAGIYDYEKKRFMYTRPLPNDAKSYAEDVLGSMEGLGGEVLKTDGTYVFRNTDYQKLHVKLCNIVPNYCELSEIPDGDWLKVLFAMAPEDVPYLEMLARNKHYSGVGFVRTADILYEMLPDQFKAEDMMRAGSFSTNKTASNLAARWVSDGLVRRVRQGVYQKNVKCIKV